METRIYKRDQVLAATFGILKQRLLLERLSSTPEAETHVLIMRQANEAALLAWLSNYPLLAFPCLFEEKASGAMECARRETQRFWDGLQAGAAARAA
jgi:hypothetical protein